MSRPLRIEYPGGFYHVMNRGRRKEKIFLSDSDYEAFIKVLQETAAGWNLQVVGYCLMSNHYHLLLHTPDGNLSRCMRHVNGLYTQRFNRAHKKDGQLFRGRYKAVLVERDRYLLEVLRYIHHNPLRAGLIKRLEDFPWSSHPGYLSKAAKWNWLSKELPLAMFSRKKGSARAAYADFVSRDDVEEIERFYRLKNLPSLLGGKEFKEWVRARFAHLGSRAEIPKSGVLAPSPSEVLRAVCDYFNTTELEIAKSRRGKENLPRDLALYLIRLCCRKTLAETGRCLGIGNYSTVSSAIERAKLRETADRKVRKKLKDIKAKLGLEQR